VFVLGVNGSIYHRATRSTSTWLRVGRPPNTLLSYPPAAVSWGYGRIDVFAVDNSGSLWHTWCNDTDCNAAGDQSHWPWEFLGHPASDGLTGGPAATSWGTGRLDVFAAGQSQHEIWHLTYDNQHWHDWNAPGWGVVGEEPAAVSWGPGRIDVAGRGGSLLTHIACGSVDGCTDGNAWTEDNFGLLQSQPGLSSGRPTWLDVFINNGGYLAYNFFRTSQWGGWATSNIALSSPPAPVAFSDGRIDVFFQSGDRSIIDMTCICWTG
jgi:hypothetical protein